MDLNDRVNALTYQETNINATRIVVAGNQSHGKTSLLEELCGVDLPRGEGIQTRVPLVARTRGRVCAYKSRDSMDTVNSIRSSVYGNEDDEKPHYFRHLTAESIAAMSNEDQKLVDLQIEVFACWKLMKKRLIDYVLLSTQGELVNTPIHKKLKSAMLDVVFRRDDAELVGLLLPDSSIVKARVNLVCRLEKLTEAMQEIDAYRVKHPGGLVDID